MIPIDAIGEFGPVRRNKNDPLSGWQQYRFEYGGHAQDCLYEGRLLLPPDVDPDAVSQLIMGMQAYGERWVIMPHTDDSRKCPAP